MLNDYPVVELVVARMESDFSNLTPKLRKPFSGKDIDAKLEQIVQDGIPREIHSAPFFSILHKNSHRRYY